MPFTRDLDQIKNALNKVEEYSKTCIETALNGVNSVILEEWSIFTPCQVITFCVDNFDIHIQKFSLISIFDKQIENTAKLKMILLNNIKKILF